MNTKLIRIYTLSALLGAGTVAFGAAEFYGSTNLGSSATYLATDDLAKASAQWTLPPELREVSGIALLEDNLMACVQDEEGAIYLYDLQQKAVIEKIKFAGPGDYEGIALNGTTAYILRSDGAIFEVSNFRDGAPDVKEHKSVLANTQNTEGLAYDSVNNRLLIACKGYDKKLGDVKGIYALDLAKKQMQPEPVIAVPLTQDRIKASKKDKYDNLQPSSLEIHPQTGELYMLDAVNNKLLVLDKQGKITKSVELDKKLFRQAEGLSFGANGEMYIASEGSKKGSGVIVKFEKGI